MRLANWVIVALLFVVLPDENGKVGEVTVEGKDKEKIVLNTAYAGTYANDQGKLTGAKIEKKAVDKTFGKALAAQPILPSRFRFYFKSDSDELTDASKPELEKLFDDIKRRDSYRIEVIGHTDRMGEDKYNAKLSLARAEAIAQFLIGRGIPADRITATGRGERDPLIPTADEKPEPRNRRVEIDVR